MVRLETQLRKYLDVVMLMYDDLVRNGLTPEQAIEAINAAIRIWREHDRNRYTE